MMGYPRDFTDLSYPRDPSADYVGCPDVQDKEAFAARVQGDSMIPAYSPSDIVIFSPSQAPRDGDDCFVRFSEGHTTFKRVFFETEKGRKMIRLQPRNEKYKAQVVPADHISGIYRAIFKYHRVNSAD